jgi:hypothetical protein
MSLLELSNKYRSIADEFLKTSRLLDVLEKYGRLEFEGAYAGNVMMDGDIDIKVIRYREFSTDDMFSILRDLHDICGDNFRSYFLKRDWDDPRIGAQYPYGRYIGLKAFVNEERWKCDIWFITEDENNRDRHQLDISQKEMTEQQRETILEFKKYRKEHKLKVSGQEIYEAVLEGAQTNPEVFFSNPEASH